MSANMGETRPLLTAALPGSELLRWYWTLAELTRLARSMRVPATGGKAALTARLAAALDGAPLPVMVRAVPARRPRAAAQLAAPVGAGTVIPEGQRCSQVLRAYFAREIGPAFHFDAFMRAFIADGAGRTLGEAVRHWHDTREAAAGPQEVGAQFEFNRFVRKWHAGHPSGTRAEALDAWREHRARPRNRERPDDSGR
ncbi:DUF6434 domain-containing protein [Streptomyces sp. NPDC002889]|uniref:DUF6434 domain-containing protein n=1 Tax=Streptomyces sp. NPDC002889 TaxID=3364669 RepID=UPI0036CC9142